MDSDLFERLRDASRLPSLPAVVLRVLELTRSETASAADVATALATDPALATRVLRFVNSPMSGAVRKVSSLQHAVSILGLRGLRLMALSLSLVSSSRGLESAAPRTAAGFSYPRFWVRSLTTAIAAKAIAKLGGGKVVAEEAFLAGLLSRLGQLVLASALPDEYGAVLAAWQRGPGELLREEEAQLGTTHLALTARLVDHWQFPEHLCRALGQLPQAIATTEALSDSESSPLAAFDPLTQVVLLADSVARLASDASERSTRRIERTLLLAQHTLGANPGDWERLLEQVARDWRETLAVLNASPADAKWLSTLQGEAREQLGEVAAATKRLTDGSREQEAQALAKASMDRVAGCTNRAAFENRLLMELERARRTGKPLTLLLVDLDPIGRHIEQYGSTAGDLLLQAAARVLQRVVRKIDVAARFGGHELAVIATDCDSRGAARLAARIRAAIPEGTVEWRGVTLRLRATIGAAVAQWPERAFTNEGLTASADAQLYLARRLGGDCVRIDPPPELVATAPKS